MQGLETVPDKYKWTTARSAPVQTALTALPAQCVQHMNPVRWNLPALPAEPIWTAVTRGFFLNVEIAF